MHYLEKMQNFRQIVFICSQWQHFSQKYKNLCNYLMQKKTLESNGTSFIVIALLEP